MVFIGFGIILTMFGFLVWDMARSTDEFDIVLWQHDTVRTRTKEEKKDPMPEPLSDHAYRGDLSAALARVSALERENQEFRKLPEAAEDVRILPDSRPDASDFTRLCWSRLSDDVRVDEHGWVMAENGRKWPDSPGWQDNTVRYPWSEDLKPGHYIRVDKIGRYGVVVEIDVVKQMVMVHFDNGAKTWQQWVRRP